MKKTKKILSTIFNIIFYAIVAFMIYTGVSARINNKIPTFCGYSFMHVISQSMEPTIMTDDVTIGKELKPTDEIEVGGIYVYEREFDGLKIIHRIIAQNDDGTYTFKGDNNGSSDPYEVSRDQIQFVYLFKINGFGKVLKLFQKPITYLYVALFYLVFFIIIPIIIEKVKAKKLASEENDTAESIDEEKNQ